MHKYPLLIGKAISTALTLPFHETRADKIPEAPIIHRIGHNDREIAALDILLHRT